MFTSEFDAEVDESESVTLQQYYREAMIQGYNFGFEVGTKEEEKHSVTSQLLCNLLSKSMRTLVQQIRLLIVIKLRQECRLTHY